MTNEQREQLRSNAAIVKLAEEMAQDWSRAWTGRRHRDERGEPDPWEWSELDPRTREDLIAAALDLLTDLTRPASRDAVARLLFPEHHRWTLARIHALMVACEWLPPYGPDPYEVDEFMSACGVRGLPHLDAAGDPKRLSAADLLMIGALAVLKSPCALGELAAIRARLEAATPGVRAGECDFAMEAAARRGRMDDVR